MNKEVFYLSNLISFSRFILLALTAHFLLEKLYSYAIVFIILIWISDLLDGYFARTRNEISELGKIIDPLADKISIMVITIILLLQGVVPVWFMIITVMRDLLIFAGGLFLKYKKNIILQSNWTGKLTVFVIGLTLLLFISRKSSIFESSIYHIEFLELLTNILILISIVMAFLSLAVYLKRFYKILK